MSVVGVGALSVAALAGSIAWEADTDHPMLNLAFFRDRRFSIAAASESLGIFGLMGVLFLQTQFLQFDLGYSPLQAGLRILPTAAMICLSAPLSPIIARRIGIKVTVAAGLAAIAGGLWQISAASTPAATYEAVVPGMLLIGLGADCRCQQRPTPSSARSLKATPGSDRRPTRSPFRSVARSASP